ncbi:hypothetical protein FH972_010651 [Carpinus fangiana]|uniref:Uncharacterized protein n=1 Tax=Carpinus fangiana TaxID=176857 RepID=A0A660KUY9_9ROSI|nr:hypothetical protein FH972_010651 [Carpinus fangiana]
MVLDEQNQPEGVSSTSFGSSTVLDEQNRPEGVSSTVSGSSTGSSCTNESLGSSQIPQHKKNSPESSWPESHHRVNCRERESKGQRGIGENGRIRK